MLVPERGDPTTKIGLFILRCIQPLSVIVFVREVKLRAYLPQDVCALRGDAATSVACWERTHNSHFSEFTSDIPCA